MHHFPPIYRLLSIVVLLWGIEGNWSSGCQVTPTRYRTNNLRNPLAIVDAKPVFSWAIALHRGDSFGNEEELGVDHHQSAYRITCYDMRANTNSTATTALPLLWDSGKVASRETLQIEYAGIPLQSLQHIQWHVQIWDEKGEECHPDPNDHHNDPWFETGLLDEKAWGTSEWIARYPHLPANTSLCSMMATTEENQVPRFRAVLQNKNIPKELVTARAYIAGLGYYQLHINGEKVGDSMLDPGWTTYSKRALYSAYDVTSLLNVDSEHDNALQSNVVGVELGNGWWNPLPILLFGRQNLREKLIINQNISSSRPMFRLYVVGFQSDGTVVPLLKSISGPSSPWTTSGSPTIFNNIYLGEKYDARLEPAFHGWATPHYNENNEQSAPWKAVIKVDVSGLGPLEVQEIPPVRKQKWLTSTLLSQNLTVGDNQTVGIFDTGVNHAGSCRIVVKQQGPSAIGKTILLRYGELLEHDGSLNVLTSVAGHIAKKNPDAQCQPEVAYQSDSIILGPHAIDWTPSWSWHGFRYIEVTTPSSVNLEDISISCFTMWSDVDVVANFSSSDPWLSDLRQLVKNTYESNLMSVQSDCPHRERFGYGGDVLGCGEAGLSIYDFSAFYRKRVLDYNDAQVVSPSGALAGFTETSPYVGIQTAGLGPQMGPIGWETFQPEAQLWLYKYYGDTRTVRESYNHTLSYIELLDRSDPKVIEGGLGDWLAVDDTDVAFTGRGFQHMSYLAFANITEILGLSANLTKHYRRRAAELVDKLNSRFLDTASGAYTVGAQKRKGLTTQTGQGMALCHGFLSTNTSLRRKALRQLIQNAHESSNMEGACQVHGKSKARQGCKSAKGGPGPHVTGGLFGMKWILMALADGGLNAQDVAYGMVTNPTYPGLRWMMNNSFANATTIWESFFFSDAFKSHNHPMFSSTEVWLLQSVAGIQPHPSAKGMDHLLIKPNPPSQLQHASASFESPRGVTTVSWARRSTNIELNVTIPPNCRATVHVPATKSNDILHNGVLQPNATWIPSVLSDHHGSYVVGVTSGRHIFKSIDYALLSSE